MQRRMRADKFAVASFLGAMLVSIAAQGAGIKDSLNVVADTNNSASASQKKIDDLARESRNLVEEYRKLLDGSEYQAAYTRELEELEQVQQQQLAGLREQIVQARLTGQRIVPLMRSMADSLEKFVVLDLPFHQEERVAAVLDLKQRLRAPDISVSAKFRILLEAFQLEQDYGGNIESWRGLLQLEGEEFSVEYLRVGRVALYYQSLDGSSSGYWDRDQQAWVPLEERYNRGLAQALRVAQNISAPQLLNLPMTVPGAGS
jgi:cell division protein FtsB